MKKDGFNQYYDEAVEPNKRARAYAWATAIGLQDVDGLKPSKYLLSTARRHIEGEISQDEARRIIDEYYETKDGRDLPRETEEADKVAARIIAVINSPTFVFSPAYLTGLHKKIFEGIFSHAGQIRDVELTKHEPVLNGASVEYAPNFLIRETLEYDFEKEREFNYKGLSDDAFVRHFAAFIAGIWQIHPFREGNTRTTALFAIKYLRSKAFDVTNDLFARESWYFRNALVRANYENAKLDVVKSTSYLEDFLKVLLYGDEIELKNRYLRIGFEEGSQAGAAIGKFHRKLPNNVPNKLPNKKSDRSEGLSDSLVRTLSNIRTNPRLTADELSELLGITARMVRSNIRQLKDKKLIVRRGSNKTGYWEIL